MSTEENDLEVLLKYYYKGIISKCEDDIRNAINYFNIALDLIASNQLSTETIKTDIFDIYTELATIYFDLHRTSKSSYALDTAFIYTNIADSLARIILTEHQSKYSNLKWKASANELYDTAINFAAKSGRLEELWSQLENNKNYVLVSNISLPRKLQSDCGRLDEQKNEKVDTIEKIENKKFVNEHKTVLDTEIFEEFSHCSGDI